MNKWIFCLFILSPCYMAAENSSLQAELTTIDQEIQSLKISLQKNQMKEMKEDVKGQGLMIGDWEAFARDLQGIHNLEDKDQDIRQHIQQLEKQKSVLIQHQMQSNHKE